MKAGYTANVVGFGWTKSVFVELMRALSSDEVNHAEQGGRSQLPLTLKAIRALPHNRKESE